jgi:hypothetical protein
MQPASETLDLQVHVAYISDEAANLAAIHRMNGGHFVAVHTARIGLV